MINLEKLKLEAKNFIIGLTIILSFIAFIILLVILFQLLFGTNSSQSEDIDYYENAR